MMKTPLALFTYNRPRHVEQTLAALARCVRLDECEVVITCDGPKRAEDAASVEASRAVVRRWADRLGARVIERAENFGLSRSITTGVSELCAQYGQVIVLEDDLIPGPDFLNYMLEGLARYQNQADIFQISGYQFPVTYRTPYDAFFLPLTTTWGWATWDRAWQSFDPAPKVTEHLQKSEVRHAFDLEGSYPYSAMLEACLANQNDSWGILWWWAVFVRKGLVVWPRTSLIYVGGADGTGTHVGRHSQWAFQGDAQVIQQFHFAEPITFPAKVATEQAAFEAVKRFLKHRHSYRTTARRLLWSRIKTKVRQFLR